VRQQYKPFNSLFEMPRRLRLGVFSQLRLSILYLRCRLELRMKAVSAP